MKPFNLTALTGLAGTGKDTVADLLTTMCGYHKIGFADALYQEVSTGFDFPVEQLRQRATKEHPLTSLALSRCLHFGFAGRMVLLFKDRGEALDLDAPRSPRQILQWWGTEYRRAIDTNYWVGIVNRKIADLTRRHTATHFVISDCRFDNEAKMVRDFGGQMWQVTRPGIEAQAGAHASETTGAAFKPDVVLANDKDIQHLQSLVLGAWLMQECGIDAHTLVRMGIAHVPMAGEEWARHIPANASPELQVAA